LRTGVSSIVQDCTASPLNLFKDARLDDHGRLGAPSLAGVAANGLNGLDNLHRIWISDLSEDDMLAIKPVSLDGGNKELRAVATTSVSEGKT